MGQTRKEFILDVVEQLKENPRAVLAGHGIASAVLQTIIQRPDVMSKLAGVLFSTKYATKGAVGLKKANNFQIKGYRNFNEFVNKAREDVETFIEKLTPEDSAAFKNSDNILCIQLLPVKNSSEVSEESTEDLIITGKSVVLNFDQAVNKAYGIAGSMYIIIMMGDSAIRPQEARKAETKAKLNKKKNARRNPAKVKSELKAKANRKLELLKKKRADLENDAFTAENELEQYKDLGNEFGVNTKNPMMVKNAMNKFDEKGKDIREMIASLDAEGKKNFDLASKYWAKGKTFLAKAYMKELNNPVLADYIKNGQISESDQIIKNRKKAIRENIASLTTKNEQLLVDLSLASAEKKNSIRSMISKNNSKIKELRVKLGTYKNISARGMMNKAAMLKATHAAIEENIAKGATIQEALNSAIAKLDATPAQKQIIKQQTIEQVANGTPMQYAVQQSIQDNIEEPIANLDNSLLTGSTSIEDLLASI